MDIDSFIAAFGNNSGGYREDCDCGRIFYNSNGGWTWEDRELEALEKNPKAIDLDWCVQYVLFDEKIHVLDCSCWKERAIEIMKFIDSHSHQIAEYLTLEKKRALEGVESMPVVREC